MIQKVLCYCNKIVDLWQNIFFKICVYSLQFFTAEMQYDNDDADIKMYKEMMQRDKRRWSTADKNGDDLLSKEEFKNFLHPEHADHMKDIVVTGNY